MLNNKNQIQLIPVIELEPYDFKKGDYESPTKSGFDAPEEWSNYNQKCYDECGLKDIKAIQIGSWFHAVEQFNADQLRIILSVIYDYEEDDLDEIFKEPIEYAPFFCGGYIFMVNNEIKATPGCCCGLESISDWKRVLESTAGQVWTGHDMDASVNFIVESNLITFEINDENFTISTENFSKIIDNIEDRLQKLIEVTGIVLNDLFAIQNGREVASAMIYK